MRIVRDIDIWLLRIAAGFAVLMMLHVVADIVARNLLAATIPATLELVSRYYMPALIFLPLAFVERANGHIQVTFIFNALPVVVRRVLTPAILALVAVVFAAMGWVALEEAIAKFRIGEFLMGEVPVPLWPGRFLTPVGFFAMAGLTAVKCVLSLAGRLPADPDPLDEAV